MSDIASAAAARALALLDLGRAKDAETVLRTALVRSPQDPQLHVELVRALLMQGRHAEALEVSATALSLAPNDHVTLLVRSLALSAVGQKTAALESVTAALNLAPDVAVLHRQRGYLLHRSKLPAEALLSYERARNFAPDDADIVAGLAAVLYDLRRNDAAGVAAADALALNPNCAHAHQIRSALALRSGAVSDAIAASSEAVRLSPTNVHLKTMHGFAMKARNPIHRWLWRYSDWLAGQPQEMKNLEFIVLVILTGLLVMVGDIPWVGAGLVLLITPLALAWVIEPLMNAVLLTNPYGRGLLPPATRRATYGFGGFAVIASTCIVLSLMTGSDAMLRLGLGSALWSASVGSLYGVPAARQRAAWFGVAVGALFVLSTLSLVLVGSPAASGLGLLLVVSGFISVLVAGAMRR